MDLNRLYILSNRDEYYYYYYYYYKNDNVAVYQNIEEAARGASVESTITPFSIRKDGRGALGIFYQSPQGLHPLCMLILQT